MTGGSGGVATAGGLGLFSPGRCNAAAAPPCHLNCTCRWEEISPLTARERNPMQIPVWLKPGLWGAASGAVVMAIVGFSQLGWKTEGTAEQLAQDRADTAVVAALVPFCVAKAQMTPSKRRLPASRLSSRHTRGAILW